MLSEYMLARCIQHTALPLPKILPACVLADLVLHKPRNQFRIQFDVCSPVASLFIIVRGRKYSDNLIIGNKETGLATTTLLETDF